MTAPARRRILLAIGLLLILSLTGYFVHEPLLRALGRYLVMSQEEVTGDIGYVLGGGRSSRADRAAELFHQKKIKRILLSGAGGLADVDGVVLLNEQEILFRMLCALKVPAEALERIAKESSSTEEEMIALQEYLNAHPGATVIIVTSDYHTRRCQWLVTKMLGEEAHRVRVTGAATGFAVDSWWKSEEGLTSGAIELLKLVSTLARFGW